MASSLYRMMAQRIGREYCHSQAKTVFRHLLNVSGKVEITAQSVVVTLDQRARNPYLVANGLSNQPRTHVLVRQQKAGSADASTPAGGGSGEA
jgi:hypothetical protein